MARYRRALPQLESGLFLADGGIETSLIFLEGLELPHFAAFVLLASPEGEAALRRYFRGYAELARRHGTGLVLETATWRASPEWGARVGYDRDALAEAHRASVRLLEPIRDEFEGGPVRIVISGCVGPRADGYVVDAVMSEDEAEAYHRDQVRTFASTAADLVTAITMTTAEEAVGVARAAQAAGMPAVISFTVETDGRLPSGESLESAIARVDGATAAYPIYYMINCAHPTHFSAVLDAGGPWLERIRGLRANASTRSHAELNESPDLDRGDPVALAREYAALRERLPRLDVLGGCCGTDVEHVEQIALACARGPADPPRLSGP